MAWIEPIKSTKTRHTTYRVCWREGGTRDGKRDSETCDTKTIAKRFKARVEAAGDQRPAGYPKGCRGIVPEAAEPTPEADPEPTADPEPQPSPTAPATAVVPTLSEIVFAYLSWLAMTGKAEPRQIALYKRRFQLHVQPAVVTLEDGSRLGPLGDVPVPEYTTEVDQAWISWMRARTYERKGEKKTYSPKTIANIHGEVISPTLSWAARKKGIPIDVNPCVGVILPKQAGRTVTLDQVPTGDEIAAWIALAYKVSDLAGDITTLALGTGLRWGEITALRVCDIDLMRGLLTVAQAVKEDEHRRLYIASYGKSDAALRTIRIGSKVVAMLARRMEGLPPKALIFPGIHTPILNPSTWQKHWYKVVALAETHGIDTQATAHKLRHAHATQLLAENVSLDTVSKRIGHKSIVTTANLYSHLSPEADRRAADVIDMVMTGTLSHRPVAVVSEQYAELAQSA
ncbi:hypothetical protein GCM10022224_103830 [Nonomuraea antimicrobica]|uniref:Tyr recombinase domain-containing protein n=1 Tax=Nonomuraea antimicrobica TaxID=561173 RepID=A0ABP7EPL0_9ACTN